MRLGVHVSIGRGFSGALQEAAEIGCESFQIFAGNPRGWARKPLQAEEARRFVRERIDSGLGPVAVHLSYLPNLAADDPEMREKSLLALGEDFRRANMLEADFFIVHPGKCVAGDDPSAALETVARAVRLVLEKIEGPTRLLLENQSGASHEVAARVEELGEILRLIGLPGRTGVCFDTCHAFAAGYDLRTAEGWRDLTRRIEESFGLSMVYLLHLNDARGELGGRLDRHAHWGEGRLGADCFRQLMRQPYWRDLPGILETPVEQPDDDRRNLAFLRAILREEHG